PYDVKACLAAGTAVHRAANGPLVELGEDSGAGGEREVAALRAAEVGGEPVVGERVAADRTAGADHSREAEPEVELARAAGVRDLVVGPVDRGGVAERELATVEMAHARWVEHGRPQLDLGE